MLSMNILWNMSIQLLLFIVFSTAGATKKNVEHWACRLWVWVLTKKQVLGHLAWKQTFCPPPGYYVHFAQPSGTARISPGIIILLYEVYKRKSIYSHIFKAKMQKLYNGGYYNNRPRNIECILWRKRTMVFNISWKSISEDTSGSIKTTNHSPFNAYFNTKEQWSFVVSYPSHTRIKTRPKVW